MRAADAAIPVEDDDAGVADGGPDAGPEPVPCEASSLKGIEVGGVGTDWQPLLEGTDLPAWPRPQGGLGTRVSARLDGWAEDANVSLLRVQAFGPFSETTCTVREDCGTFETCVDGLCRIYIVNQTYGMFDLVCLDDGALFAAELEVLFRGDMVESQLDDLPVEVIITAESDGEPSVAGSVNGVLRAGPFIKPSWWED